MNDRQAAKELIAAARELTAAKNVVSRLKKTIQVSFPARRKLSISALSESVQITISDSLRRTLGKEYSTEVDVKVLRPGKKDGYFNTYNVNVNVAVSMRDDIDDILNKVVSNISFQMH